MVADLAYNLPNPRLITLSTLGELLGYLTLDRGSNIWISRT